MLTNDGVNKRSIKISKVDISSMPVFFVDKYEKLLHSHNF